MISNCSSSLSKPDSAREDYHQLSTLAVQAQSELESLHRLLTDSETASLETEAIVRDRLLALQNICNRAIKLLPERDETKEELQADIEESECSLSLQGTVNAEHFEVNPDGSFSMASTNGNMRMLLRCPTIYRMKVHQIQVSGEVMNI